MTTVVVPQIPWPGYGEDTCVKILDRYISISVAAAFLSGVTMFMVLLCAMSLMKELIELIAKQGVPAGMAITIFAYKIPGMLVYAFPMAVLLGILLTFSRMSSESEMVAIRAAGVSFIRIVIPTLFIALLVAGLTFWISNYYAPYASKKSLVLEQAALEKLQTTESVRYVYPEKGTPQYAIVAEDLDVKEGVMKDVTIIYYLDGIPTYLMYADSAKWDTAHGRWKASGAHVRLIGQTTDTIRMDPGSGADAELSFESKALALTKSPFELSTADKDPADLTSDEIRAYVAQLKEDPDNNMQAIGKWSTRLVQRYSTPLTCLVFALIGAPLGLRHHRTSSAVGMGVSLLVIFAYYFFSVYLATFGDSGRLSPYLAAWTPNVLGAMLGTWLIFRANR